MPVLDFKGKSVVEFHHRTVPHHRLTFEPDLSLLPDGGEPSLNGNLVVEGDNLRALKALLPTHRGRVKCVYIDPPYNTGNEGWVYNDNLTQPQFKEWVGKEVGKEGEDATRHDKWCCMMLPRLQLLRELMRDDGAIFVSIDDNEVHNLRYLLDEAFGAENFVATFVWEKSDSPKNSARHVSEDHEYVMAYARILEKWDSNLLPRSSKMKARYKNPDDDPRGSWLLSDLAARNPYAGGKYSITTPSGKIIDGPPAGSYWRISKVKFAELDADDRIWWGESGDNRPGIKRFLSEVRDGVIPQTLLRWKDVGSTRHAKQDVNHILAGTSDEGGLVTPKPVGLIERLLTVATGPGDLVLDSFAGTGTTGEAVLKMNAEADDGEEPRRFVLVQQPYDTKSNETDDYNICRNMTAARVRNAALGYVYDRKRKGVATSVEVPGLGGSFTYAKLGDPLFADYRSWAGEAPPDFGTLAAYVFATETGRPADPALFDERTGFIGSTAENDGTSYYLLYTPNQTVDRQLTIPALDALLKTDENPRWVVYAERLWFYPEQLREWREENRRGVRAMLVPFGLK